MSTSLRPINVVAAMMPDRGIGKNGRLPWPKIRTDFEHYITLCSTPKDRNKKCINIKGRKSFEEGLMLKSDRPNVLTIVISTTLKSCPPHVFAVVQSWDEAMDIIHKPPLSDITDSVWVLGGRRIFQEALSSPSCERLYLTRVHNQYDSDTFLPTFEQDFTLVRYDTQGEYQHLEVVKMMRGGWIMGEF